MASDNPDIQFQDFSVQKLMGKGCYSRVYSVKKTAGNDRGVLYAMKIINLVEGSATRCVARERAIFGKFDNPSPFVTSLFYSFIEGKRAFMATTLAPCGDLFDVLQELGTLTESDARFYISELLIAVEYLHSKNIVHLDIKPENILLENQGHIYLCDFDRAFDLDSTPDPSDFQGTALYMAPEIARSEIITTKADVWSVGMVAGEMVAGALRSTQNTSAENSRLAKEGRYSLRPPKALSKPYMAFLNATFRKKHTERPSVTELKNLRFLKPVKWDLVLAKAMKPPFDPAKISRTEPKTCSNLQMTKSTEPSGTSVDFPSLRDFYYVLPDLIVDGFRKNSPG